MVLYFTPQHSSTIKKQNVKPARKDELLRCIGFIAIYPEAFPIFRHKRRSTKCPVSREDVQLQDIQALNPEQIPNEQLLGSS